jgi:hypothetical protein
MRSVHVLIAATTLAVPASAFAFTGVTSELARSAQNPVQTPLNLQVNPRQVRFGGTVAVRGTAPATNVGRRVLLQTKPAGQAAWRPLGSAVVTRAGAFHARVRPRRSGALRAVAPPDSTAVAGAAPAVSASAPAVSASAPAVSASASPRTATVTVGARFTPARHQSAVLSTRRVRVGGKLLPAIAGRRVRLEANGAHGWRTVSSDRTDPRGGYGLSFSAGGADGQHLRVVFGGDGVNAGAARPVGSVALLHPALASWYEDGGTTACGFHAGLGVANRTLPCGTKVTFSHGGRTVTATVDDRGPYAGGRDWDLNQATAGALGFAGVGTVWASR